MVRRTLSHYQVLEEIGRGGMSVVYRALDLKLDRDVAVKVLPSELVLSSFPFSIPVHRDSKRR